jgi:hypothetical protein
VVNIPNSVSGESLHLLLLTLLGCKSSAFAILSRSSECSKGIKVDWFVNCRIIDWKCLSRMHSAHKLNYNLKFLRESRNHFFDK